MQQRCADALAACAITDKNTVHQKAGVFSVPFEQGQKPDTPRAADPAVMPRKVTPCAANEGGVKSLEANDTQQRAVCVARTKRVRRIEHVLDEPDCAPLWSHHAAKFLPKSHPIHLCHLRVFAVIETL